MSPWLRRLNRRAWLLVVVLAYSTGSWLIWGTLPWAWLVALLSMVAVFVVKPRGARLMFLRNLYLRPHPPRR